MPVRVAVAVAGSRGRGIYLDRGGKGRRLTGSLLLLLQEREPGYEQNEAKAQQGAAGEADVPRPYGPR